MRNLARLFAFGMTTALLLPLSSCDQTKLMEDPNQPTTEEPKKPSHMMDDQYEIKQYIQSLSDPKGLSRSGNPEDGTPIVVDNPTQGVEPGTNDGMPGYWVTTTQKYKMSQTFDETILLDPSIAILYPGCVIDGRTIATATYAPITSAPVGNVTYSISKFLANGAKSSDALVNSAENIRMSDYRKALNEWARLEYKSNAFNTTHEFHTVNSLQEAAMKAGLTVKNDMFDLQSKFNFNFNRHQNHFLVKFIQKQFSVTIDFPKQATIFAAIDPRDMAGVKPAYVSNINYGRIIYLSIDTDEKMEDIQAAINFVLKKVKGVDVSADLETKYTNTLSKSDVSMTILGGGNDIQSKVLTNGLESIYQYMTADIPMNEMAAISFALNYADDNSLARVVSQTEYEVSTREFVKDFKEMRVEMEIDAFRSEGAWGNENEIFGKVTAQYKEGEPQYLFNAEKADYRVNVKDDWAWHTFKLPTVHLTMEKPEGMTVDAFLTKEMVKINANLSEDDGPSAPAYAPVTESVNLSSLIGLSRDKGNYIYMETRTGTKKVGFRVRVNKVYFLSKDGKQVE